jgi:hypothetical protein
MPYLLDSTLNIDIQSSDGYVNTILKDLSNFSAQFLSTYNFSLAANEEYTVIDVSIPNTFLVAVKGTEALDVALTKEGLIATAFKQGSVEYQAATCTPFTPLNVSGDEITVHNSLGVAYPIVATPDLVTPYTSLGGPLSVYYNNGTAVVPLTGGIVSPIASTAVDTAGNYTKAASTIYLKIFNTSVGATITQIKVLNSTSTSNIVSVAIAHGLLV